MVICWDIAKIYINSFLVLLNFLASWHLCFSRIIKRRLRRPGRRGAPASQATRTGPNSPVSDGHELQRRRWPAAPAWSHWHWQVSLAALADGLRAESDTGAWPPSSVLRRLGSARQPAAGLGPPRLASTTGSLCRAFRIVGQP
jgi:hypothetical protein